MTKGNVTKIVFRGKNDDADLPHAYDTIKGKTRDYSALDALYRDVQRAHPENQIEIVS